MRCGHEYCKKYKLSNSSVRPGNNEYAAFLRFCVNLNIRKMCTSGEWSTVCEQSSTLLSSTTVKTVLYSSRGPWSWWRPLRPSASWGVSSGGASLRPPRPTPGRRDGRRPRGPRTPRRTAPRSPTATPANLLTRPTPRDPSFCLARPTPDLTRRTSRREADRRCAEASKTTRHTSRMTREKPSSYESGPRKYLVLGWV